MKSLSSISDSDLIAIMPSLVLAEHACTADVIAHLVEIDRRRLYLDQACSSLSAYCTERLSYSEDEAVKRVRVARLAGQFPRVLDELRSGAIHLTGLFLLSRYLTPENCDQMLTEARNKSKHEIELLIVRSFPRPEAPERISAQPEQLDALGLNGSGSRGSGTGPRPILRSPAHQRLQPLSPTKYSIQFTANAELREKIERAREILSHAVPSGDLAIIFERALDRLIEHETKRRTGSGKPRKRRSLSPGSRHIPIDVQRVIRERDGNQCTFVDEHGRRCSARKFLTIEHREPFARGGPPTVENLCLLCKAHNHHEARRVFGDAHIEAKRAERTKTKAPAPNDVVAKVHIALRKLGFSESEVRLALSNLRHQDLAGDAEKLLRAALLWLVPPGPSRRTAPPNLTCKDSARCTWQPRFESSRKFRNRSYRTRQRRVLISLR